MVSVPNSRTASDTGDPGDPASPSGPSVVPLAAAASEVRFGRKAATLARLLGAGLPVPDGFVVTSDADLASATVAEVVASALDRLGGGPVAVRSSSPVEDLADASFAGLYETELGVRGVAAVIAAIDRVRTSGASARAAAYRRQQAPNGADVQMAVLVQRMVDATAAGVAFSADPLSGDRSTAVVSAVRGLGDKLVSGESAAQEWAVGPDHATLLRPADGAVDATAARRVADLARRLEAAAGSPQDVEWALADEQLFVLQARPMTALPEEVSWNPGLPGVWMRDIRLGEWLGGPVTPLFESWGLTRIEGTMDRTLGGLLGIEPSGPSHVVVNGWYFYGFNFLPSNPRDMVVQLVRHVLPSFLARPRQAAMTIPPLAGFGIGWAERQWRDEILPRYRARVERARAQVETADPAGLVALVDDLTGEAGAYFASVTMVAGYASKTEVPLARFYRGHVAPRIGGSHLELLVGLAAEPRAAAPHALRSLDWFEPTLGEVVSGGDGHPSHDPAASHDRHRLAAEQRSQSETAAREALADRPRLLRQFERLLGRAQLAARRREEQIADFSLAWPVMRRAIGRLGDAQVADGVIATAEQVHFLTRTEVDAALAGDRTPLSAAADRRRAAWLAHTRLVPPLRFGTLPPMIDRFLSDATDAIRGSLGEAGATGDAVVGIPVSPGRAQGPARVVRTLDEAQRVSAGDVLVAPLTAPAWTPLFGRIAAIVTDTGGVAAHASIVAREYGLPAVVGTGDATLRIRDGELVEVDGSTGIVRRLE